MKIQIDKESLINIASIVISICLLVILFAYMGKQDTQAALTKEEIELQYYEKDPLHFVPVLNERINFYQAIGDEQSVNRLSYRYERCIETEKDCPRTMQEALDY